jgi:hypothetical protein
MNERMNEGTNTSRSTTEPLTAPYTMHLKGHTWYLNQWTKGKKSRISLHAKNDMTVF